MPFELCAIQPMKLTVWYSKVHKLICSNDMNKHEPSDKLWNCISINRMDIRYKARKILLVKPTIWNNVRIKCQIEMWILWTVLLKIVLLLFIYLIDCKCKHSWFCAWKRLTLQRKKDERYSNSKYASLILKVLIKFSQ